MTPPTILQAADCSMSSTAAGSLNPQLSLNAFDMMKKRKIEYKDVNVSTKLSTFDLEQRVGLYDEFYSIITAEGSKTKKENRIIVKSMLDTIADLIKDCKKKNSELKKLSEENLANKSPPVIMNSYSNDKFSSYADCLSNKKKEHLIIIKKKNEHDGSILKDKVYEQLVPIKKDIEFKKIKDKKFTLILDAKNTDQQDLIINKLKDCSAVVCSKPRRLIPSILIKDIDRPSDTNNYVEYLKDEIADDLQIDKENVNIKAIINNPKFRSMRCIINLDEASTIKVINRNYIKIGFMACSIEKTFKVFSCRSCHSFDHKTSDCKEERCGLCSELKHGKDENCKAKDDHQLTKCINCGGNHPSFSFKCPTRLDILKKLLDRSIC